MIWRVVPAAGKHLDAIRDLIDRGAGHVAINHEIRRRSRVRRS